MVLDDFDGLLRWHSLQDWVQAQPAIPGTGPVTAVRQLTGGSQNNVFWCTRDGGEFVLRRPPLHLRPNSNDTMRREARVLAALSGSAVPHPTFHALCDDESVIGVCFYVMGAVEGHSPLGGLPGRYATNASWQRAVAFDLVDAAAALGAVDIEAVGLADFGRAEDWAVRQVPRWRRQLDGYAAFEGWDPAGLAGIDAVAEWLSDNVPPDHRIGIIHGDLQWANVLIAPDAPRVAAIIDWELSTLGDPLADFTYHLMQWEMPSSDRSIRTALCWAKRPARTTATRAGSPIRRSTWRRISS